MSLRFERLNRTPADYERVAAVNRAVWPEEADDAQTIAFEDEAWVRDHFFERVMGVNEAGVDVAYGYYCETWWADSQDQYELNLMVVPAYRNQGFGSQLYDYILTQLADRRPVSLLANSREDEPAGLHFLLSRGFEVQMKEPRSQLDLARFDPAPFQPLLQQVEASGIDLLTLKALQARDEEWLAKLYDLEWEIELDIPYFEEKVREPLEEFMQLFKRPGYYPDGWFIAVERSSGALVGASNVWLSPGRPDTAQTGLTGVIRSHRRRGLARALKAAALTFLKTQGYRWVRTENEENNPMFQLNLQLGFKPLPAWVFFKKEIETRDKRSETGDG